MKVHEPRIGIVVFARYDSSRLHGKALATIGSRPMLGHVFDRLRKVEGGHPLVLATTARPVDDAVASFAEQEPVRVFRGDTHDVTRRALDCANNFQLTDIVRISGDSPFIDPKMVERAIAIHHAERPDLTTNVDPRTFPFGCSVEVISRDALERCNESGGTIEDREHVTRPIYLARERYRIRNFESGNPSFAGVRLVVDTAQDRDRAEWIVQKAGARPADAPLETVVTLAKQWAELIEGTAGAPQLQTVKS
jgi:spore coat polysaccharide biosynthesis protein SpsF